MKSQLNHITHASIPIFINNNSSTLILGSLPSVKSRECGFYYGHKMNRFFPVLSKIFNEKEPITIDERKEFLVRHNIALYDVIYECDIYGSSDSSIKNPIVIDIEEILRSYPHIKTIGVNGGKAKALFDKYLLPKINDKDIRIIYLPSTSPANAKMGVDDLTEEYKKLFNL